MRVLTLFLIAGLVLAVSGPVQATTVLPNLSDYDQPLYMHVHNVAMGATYTGQLKPVGGGATFDAYDSVSGKWWNYTSSAYDLNASPLYTPAQAVANAATGAKLGENGWGLVQIDDIYQGINLGANNIALGGAKLWQTGQGGMALVAAYFNRQDLGVQFLSTDYAHQSFEYRGDTFEIWMQPAAATALLLGQFGSSDRVIIGGVLQDMYKGIGYNAAGGILPGATKILSGGGEVGYFGTLANTTGIADFTLIGNTGSGSADQFYSITGGTEMLLWDRDIFTPTKVGGNTADLRIHVTDAPILIKPNPKFDWLTSSSDPLTGGTIPEPVTMAGMLLGVGCLGRYIRKRR